MAVAANPRGNGGGSWIAIVSMSPGSSRSPVAAAQSLAELAKKQRLTRTRRRGLIRERRERQVAQERRRLGGRFEADARFLVERLDAGTSRPSYRAVKASRTGRGSDSSRVAPAVGAGRTRHDLGDHRRSQRRRGRRLRHVDLEETRQLDLGGQRLERARNGAVSSGRDTQSRGVDGLELLPGEASGRANEIVSGRASSSSTST